jgi:hypothetical protein
VCMLSCISEQRLSFQFHMNLSSLVASRPMSSMISMRPIYGLKWTDAGHFWDCIISCDYGRENGWTKHIFIWNWKQGIENHQWQSQAELKSRKLPRGFLALGQLMIVRI